MERTLSIYCAVEYYSSFYTFMCNDFVWNHYKGLQSAWALCGHSYVTGHQKDKMYDEFGLCEPFKGATIVAQLGDLCVRLKERQCSIRHVIINPTC